LRLTSATEKLARERIGAWSAPREPGPMQDMSHEARLPTLPQAAGQRRPAGKGRISSGSDGWPGTPSPLRRGATRRGNRNAAAIDRAARRPERAARTPARRHHVIDPGERSESAIRPHRNEVVRAGPSGIQRG